MLIEIDDEMLPAIRKVAQKLSGWSAKEWAKMRTHYDDPVAADIEAIVDVLEVEADAIAKERAARLRSSGRTRKAAR
jgi:hypothetical protein